MDVAEWIIVAILSLTLFVFLTLGIILLIKLLDLSRDTKHLVRQFNRIAAKGNRIADDARDTVASVKSATNSTAKTVKKDVTATTGVIKDAVVSAVSKKFGLDDEEEVSEEKKSEKPQK
ncbi:hypothetical protein IJH46_01435 [Candidatus Saccharibacteria bacterium]|nr:hypothetical protein [Candidatus Saccharibacteria bacterium]